MRNFKIKFLMLLSVALMIPTATLATENVVDVDSASSLTTCTQTTGNTCKVTSEIELDSVLEISNSITIDLNGFTIKSSNSFDSRTGIVIVHNGGTLTINDTVGTGKISGINGINVYAGVQVTMLGDTDENPATLIVNGGTIEGNYYGITGNGTRNNTNITINGGTIRGLAVGDNVGIYHPQYGTLIVNGGTITGATGIEMRSGDLTVNGGTIEGTYKPLVSVANGNGSTTIGAGISVVQHTTEQILSASIVGGTIRGYVPLYQANTQGNDAEAIERVSLNVNGGNFVTINDGTEAVHSENIDHFIAQGSFKGNFEIKYLYNENTVILNGENDTKNIFTKHNITVNSLTNGTITSDKTKDILDGNVTLTITPSTGYELDTLSVLDDDSNAITVTNNTFAMPNTNVTVSATFKKSVYTVTKNTIENGTVNADKATASYGDSVALTVTPSTGYELDTLSVKDSSNNAIIVTNNAFTMPSTNVVISATFKRVSNTITIDTLTNGNITANATALYNDKVELVITPNDNYELDTLSVKDASNNNITVTNNAFTMPATAVTIKATFKAVVREVNIPTIDTSKEVTKPTISVSEDVEDVLLDSLNNDTELLNSIKNESVKVEIEVSEVKEENIDSTVLDSIKDKVKGSIVNFFDITLAVKNANNNNTVGELSELTEEIELKILLPENLRNTDKDVNRKYYIVREHNGVIDLIEATLSTDGKYLVFKSDKFSTYALAYQDVIANPNTSDSVFNYIVLCTISLTGLGLSTIYVTKKRFN